MRAGGNGVDGGDDRDTDQLVTLEPLAEHDQPGQRGEGGLHAHDHAEQAGRDVAQDDQVDGVGHGRTEYAGHRGERDGRRRQPSFGGEPDEYRNGEDGRHQRCHGGSLQAGQPRPDVPVEQDVARPAGRRGEGERETQHVRARPGQDEHVDADAGTDGTSEVDPGARGGERNRERPEELQRHRQSQADAVDCRVQAEVHDDEHAAQREHRPPLGPAESSQRRSRDRDQDQRGDDLADRDHADRTDRAEGVSADRCAELIARPTGDERGGAGGGPATGVVHPSRMRAQLDFEKCNKRVSYTIGV
ncbi:MAG TPA: hypothetical protein VGN18_10585 [Jatrophihabitans sp.]|nr:hypothetical protein [Jatrophihabitans sp.]